MKFKPISCFLCLCLIILSACTSRIDNIMVQLTNQSHSQMMGYVIDYNGYTIVVDGGTVDDAKHLESIIKEVSDTDTVDAWFLTHYHKDHTGALAYLLESNSSINIKNVYHNFPDEEWVETYEYDRLSDFQYISSNLNFFKNVSEFKENDVITVGDAKVEVLRDFDPSITINSGNNSSSVFRIDMDELSVLFLGDLGIEGGEQLIEKASDKIKNMDYVQMSHHGQAGVSFEVYKIVNPKYCLWPTTDWLWENSDNKYKTNETKIWMEKLDVEKNFVSNKNDIFIPLNRE